MIRLRSGVKHLVRRFRRSQRGNVAMMAGIALPVLLMISAGAIDLHHMAKVRSELQDALDAATLAVARSNSTTAAEVQNIGMASLRANMPGYYIGNSGDVAAFTLDGKSKVQATATVQVRTIVANIFLPPYGKLMDDYMPMSASSDVMRASRNVEVAIALDITYSMEQSSSMGGLKTAAYELIDIVVQDSQKPYTSRAAIVPYSAAVNYGSLASIVRGGLKNSVSISSLNWADNAQVTVDRENVTVTGGVNNRTAKFVVNGHGMSSNKWIILRYGTQEYPAKITKTSNSEFTVSHIGAKATSGKYYFQRCSYDECRARIVTREAHGLVAGDLIGVTGQSGTLGSSSVFGTVVSGSANDFYITPTDWGTTASANGGSFYCGSDGCEKRIYQRRAGGLAQLNSTPCVSERPGEPRDAAPGDGNWLGRAYMTTSSSSHYRCPTAEIMPLSNSKKDLKDRIGSMSANGTTAGHIGIENAWYLLSPSWGGVFPTGVPNEYNPSETVKAVVLMTDGNFNTPYCNGVARYVQGVENWDRSAYGQLEPHYIACSQGNMPKAENFEKSVAICDAMKSKGIVIYTVAFALNVQPGSRTILPIDSAEEVMRECASSSENFRTANDTRDLQEAFRAIGRDITRLRIAR